MREKKVIYYSLLHPLTRSNPLRKFPNVAPLLHLRTKEMLNPECFLFYYTQKPRGWWELKFRQWNQSDFTFPATWRRKWSRSEKTSRTPRFVRKAPKRLQREFFSCVRTFLFPGSFRSGGRDLDCKWRQAGRRGTKQSACCCSGYHASGATPLAAVEQPFTDSVCARARLSVRARVWARESTRVRACVNMWSMILLCPGHYRPAANSYSITSNIVCIYRYLNMFYAYFSS